MGRSRSIILMLELPIFIISRGDETLLAIDDLLPLYVHTR